MELDDVASLLGPVGAVVAADTAIAATGRPFVLRPGRSCGPDQAVEVAVRLRAMASVTIVVGDPYEVPAALAVGADVCLSTRPDPPRPWVAGPVEPVVAAVEEQPLAALALVTLLRATEGLPVWEAVASESATYGMLLGSAPFRAWLNRRGPARHRPAEGPPLVVTRQDGVLTVELARPAVRNAVDSALRDALAEALAIAQVDPTVAEVRVCGRGPSFCSGGDLDEFGVVPDGATAHAVRLARHPGLAVSAVADRTTAFLHGACVGAGVEFPAFAGTVVADPGATFRLPELGLGLVPGAGGTVSVPRRVGRQRAAWLALTGAPLDGPTALSWGLVDRLAGHDAWPTVA